MKPPTSTPLLQPIEIKIPLYIIIIILTEPLYFNPLKGGHL